MLVAPSRAVDGLPNGHDLAACAMAAGARVDGAHVHLARWFGPEWEAENVGETTTLLLAVRQPGG